MGEVYQIVKEVGTIGIAIFLLVDFKKTLDNLTNAIGLLKASIEDQRRESREIRQIVSGCEKNKNGRAVIAEIDYNG